jgi:hypothetical protein
MKYPKELYIVLLKIEYKFSDSKDIHYRTGYRFREEWRFNGGQTINDGIVLGWYPIIDNEIKWRKV